MKAIADRREGDRLVAEDRLAREDRDDLGDHPHRRQDHDVDLGVPEEPEHVLVEERVAALVGDEEVRARPGGRAGAASRPAPITGRTTISSPAYTSIDQTKSGIRIQVMPGARMLWIVTMKLIAPASDEIVSRWSERIQRSWPWPRVNAFSESGTYAVQPDLRRARPSRASSSRGRPRRAGTSSRRTRSAAGTPCPGRRSSAARGSCRSPARIGTTTRKIIVVPCIVKSWLYWSRVTKCSFGVASCARMNSASSPPSTKKTRLVDDVEDPDPLVVDGRDPARDAAALPVGRGTARPQPWLPLGPPPNRLLQVGRRRLHLVVCSRSRRPAASGSCPAAGAARARPAG